MKTIILAFIVTTGGDPEYNVIGVFSTEQECVTMQSLYMGGNPIPVCAYVDR